MNDLTKNIVLWVVILFVLMFVFKNFSTVGHGSNEVPYSEFVQKVEDNRVSKVVIRGNNIDGELGRGGQGGRVHTYNPGDQQLIDTLLKNDVEVSAAPPEKPGFLMTLLINWFPLIVLVGLWFFFLRQVQGGGGRGAMSFGKSKARLLGEDQIKVTFADVAGVDEAKDEVSEMVDFLRDPGKYQKLGGKIPRGALMVGPPGTGKTLLARAIAGEAKVPFFTISGSDFVEMFVGVGASRVRDMFEQAKKAAPCIIFIDEIDAVGRHRGAGLGGGHDEREQTLNQLLVEMDGFEGNEGVIVIAATNRPDVLDPALLRPGRFDRQVTVGLPDIRGREQILKVHMRKVPIDDNAEASLIARGTPGFSGADLANLVNEAALFAARLNKRLVGMQELEKAKDKILMGAEKKSMVMNEIEKRNTAFHEAGHAIIGRTLPDHDPVYKVTIIPRGRALGVTMFLPEDDRYSYSKDFLEANICSLFGGRLAEELTFGKGAVTTGASNDIERATEIARNMVTKWGLSELMGPLAYSEDDGEVFLGRSVTQHKQVSDETAHEIDKEIRVIINRNYDKAEQILVEKSDVLKAMADALMKYETIDAAQIEDLMEGKTPRPPKGWDDDGPEEDSGNDKSDGQVSKKDSNVTPIGGPANEH
ncbi:MAG: ATP-dependent zinc metalloprotease FtsH [Methylococcales bacterium]|nr:ATP-dependent zinc metalloprotease FtsH [Methylococcales bacterium]